MHPIEFSDQNKVWAKNQPDYLPLPAYTDTMQTVSCWKLSLWERLYVLFTGKMWLYQLNFSRPLQPQLLTVESPFIKRGSKTNG